MARTNNDQAHLHRLRDTYAQIGCLPSYSQIANVLGFKAKNAAFKLAQRLIPPTAETGWVLTTAVQIPAYYPL